MRPRPAASTALVIAAAVLLLVALVLGYARRAAFDADQFANRATAVLEDDAVQDLVAERVTDGVLLRAEPDLLAARPAIVAAAKAVVGGAAFRRLWRGAVTDVHRTVVDGDEDTVVLTLADVAVVLEGALRAIDPRIAGDLDTERRVRILRRDVGAATADATQAAGDVRLLAPLALALAVVLGAAGFALSADRRRSAAQLGGAIAALGALLFAGLVVARPIVLGGIETPEGRAAAGAVWDAFLGDLRTGALLLAVAGAIVAGAATSVLRPAGFEVERPLRRAWAWLTTEPQGTWPRLGRGALLVVAGVVLVARRDAAIAVAATAAGLYVLYKGVEAILRVVAQPRELRAATEAGRPAPRPRRLRRLAAPALAAAAVVAIGAAFAGNGGTSTAAPRIAECNGHSELCDRRLDEIALAATHNAMSAPLPGWYSSAQEAGIRDQLDAGVRALLLDTHYGIGLGSGRVRTDLEAEGNDTRTQLTDGLGPEATAAALRLRGRAGFAGEGERGVYMCHTFCELGATRFSDGLADVREFLVSNPGEVVVIVNQDAVAPEDVAREVEQAGLLDLVYRGPVAPRFRTLREMIDADERLVVLAEQDAGRVPWYHAGYERALRETPFRFTRRQQLLDPDALEASCRPNRGREDAPLFLLNHWIATDPAPLPSNARRVNAYEPLLRRVRACERRRGAVPNLLAVDFFGEGDVVRVADALNGLRERG